MDRCATCLDWVPPTHDLNLGECDSQKWKRGYHIRWEDVAPDEVLVEDDEGWAFHPGPEFGCIHHKPKAPR